mmetsp:Transcript_18127/g.59199  ORF Transcript_18127/g.59199 Transcript_18127/m.59199 type:complete len:392 (+) Transcript_18127:2443-3618(+)
MLSLLLLAQLELQLEHDVAQALGVAGSRCRFENGSHVTGMNPSLCCQATHESDKAIFHGVPTARIFDRRLRRSARCESGGHLQVILRRLRRLSYEAMFFQEWPVERRVNVKQRRRFVLDGDDELLQHFKGVVGDGKHDSVLPAPCTTISGWVPRIRLAHDVFAQRRAGEHLRRGIELEKIWEQHRAKHQLIAVGVDGNRRVHVLNILLSRYDGDARVYRRVTVRKASKWNAHLSRHSPDAARGEWPFVALLATVASLVPAERPALEVTVIVANHNRHSHASPVPWRGVALQRPDGVHSEVGALLLADKDGDTFTAAPEISPRNCDERATHPRPTSGLHRINLDPSCRNDKRVDRNPAHVATPVVHNVEDKLFTLKRRELITREHLLEPKAT